MRRLLVCFYIVEHLVYITLDIAGVGKRIIMQKGVFAYKSDEKCISHKNLLQRFDINAYKIPIFLYKDGMSLCCLIPLSLMRGPFTATSNIHVQGHLSCPVYSALVVVI